MFKARDFRRIARDKLRGWMWKALAVSLVAGILMGSLQVNFTFPLRLTESGISFSDSDTTFYYGGGSYTPGSRSPSGSTFSFDDPEGLGDAVWDAIRQLFDNIEPRQLMGFAAAALIWTLIFGLLFLGPIAFIISCVGSSANLGHCLWYISRTDGRDSKFNLLFSRFRIFFKAGWLTLFTGIFVWLWSLLLVIPGIIAAYRYWAAPWIMAEDPAMQVRDAVNRSKEMMRGRKWRLFCLQLSFIGWDMLNILTFGIGTLWLKPYKTAAYAAFYFDAAGRRIPVGDMPEEPAAPVQPAPQQFIPAPEPYAAPEAQPATYEGDAHSADGGEPDEGRQD